MLQLSPLIALIALTPDMSCNNEQAIKGLGDIIAGRLESIGFSKARVSRWLGRDCGCDERQRRLNQLGEWIKRHTLYPDQVKQEAEEQLKIGEILYDRS